MANRSNINRPNTGKLPTPSTRPSGGSSTRPGGLQPGNIANRPNVRPGGGDFRPSGGRPSAGDLDKFLNLPSGGGMSRPSFGAAVAGGALAGGAAAEFLHDRPTPFPGGPGAGDIASTLPATRPGGGGEGTRPSRPGEGGGGEQNRPGRPGEGGEGVRPGRPGEDGGGIRPDRPNNGDRPLRPDRPETRPGQGGRGEQWKPGHHPDRIPDWNKWSNWRHDHHNDVWDHWHNNWHNNWHDCNHWYNNDWWRRHGWNYPYYPNYNYWGWAAWPAVTGWVDYGWQQPVSYNYGDNVYYQGDQVYYGDQPVATATEYADQAAAIATNIPATKPDAKDWMPLGVFAMTHDGEPTGADPTMFLQLSVSKQGIINGTWQNTATDESQQIEGMVDKQTQRAAWTPVGKDRPIMETGIVNLTQETTPALVHFADGSTQQWLLVRLDKPKEGEATQKK